ncbi:cell envelope integrity TolA C-terminal domain-containing protein [Enterobacillus tribolii]|uniref:TolA-like protein n=1 Tax=Enterobacillus tribolii TaxID=1487935 RepID=A0A370QNQ4_9GAMM|nr:cell envelope integrity TolA C-terminal domain-containing protein [Enterobacillus tribolii]MBW7982019.1 hypothetical protein [Enterobacillus tribolii]RDK89962.1 TolA-like protein [Enterobacillus tribolii]
MKIIRCLLAAFICISSAGCQQQKTEKVLLPGSSVPIHFGEKYTGNDIQEYATLLRTTIQYSFYEPSKWQGKTCSLKINMDLRLATYESGDIGLCQAAMKAAEKARLPEPTGELRNAFRTFYLEFAP